MACRNGSCGSGGGLSLGAWLVIGLVAMVLGFALAASVSRDDDWGSSSYGERY
jgi:hypothetical protein